jgi:hypothetical protein
LTYGTLPKRLSVILYDRTKQVVLLLSKHCSITKIARDVPPQRKRRRVPPAARWPRNRSAAERQTCQDKARKCDRAQLQHPDRCRLSEAPEQTRLGAQPSPLCYTRGVRWHGPFGSRVRLDGLPPPPLRRSTQDRGNRPEIVRHSARRQSASPRVCMFAATFRGSGRTIHRYLSNRVFHPKQTRSHETAPRLFDYSTAHTQ